MKKMQLKINNQYLKEFIAEVFGTFLLVVFINGAVVQNFFYTKDNPQLNSNLTIFIVCGFAVCMAILTIGKISGNLIKKWGIIKRHIGFGN